MGCFQTIPLLILELKLKSLQAEGNQSSQCPEQSTEEIPNLYLLSLMAAPWTWPCFDQQNEKLLVGKAGSCIHIWLYCFIIISRENKNEIMIIKLNHNLLTGATKLFISTFQPNSLTTPGCLLCVPGQAILTSTC